MSIQNLPPLKVGTAYQATDFERFEYLHHSLISKSEQKSIFRLYLKTGPQSIYPPLMSS